MMRSNAFCAADGLHATRKSSKTETGKRRRGAVRAGVEPLALGDGDFVVDPAVSRVPLPGVAILGRNIDAGRTVGVPAARTIRSVPAPCTSGRATRSRSIHGTVVGDAAGKLAKSCFT